MGRYDSVATDKLKFCRRVGFFASDASAAIAQTSATFLRIVGSELIQKYLGDGPKLVREMFRLADEQVALMTVPWHAGAGVVRPISLTHVEILGGGWVLGF